MKIKENYSRVNIFAKVGESLISRLVVILSHNNSC